MVVLCAVLVVVVLSLLLRTVLALLIVIGMLFVVWPELPVLECNVSARASNNSPGGSVGGPVSSSGWE